MKSLPRGWNQITIKQFICIHEILTKDEIALIDRFIHVLSYLTGESVDYFESLPIKNLKRHIARIRFLAHPDKIKRRLPFAFHCKGRIFKPCYRFSKYSRKQLEDLKVGQYIDFMHFTKTNEGMKEMHKLLAAVCVPVRYLFFAQPYSGTRHTEISEFFYENLTMDRAYPILLFFSAVSIELMQDVQSFQSRLMTEVQSILQTKTRTGLPNTGDC